MLLSTAWVLLAHSDQAKADRGHASTKPLLLGGSVEVHRPQARIDPLLPSGDTVAPSPLPPLPIATPRVERCSLTAPVCVRGEETAELESPLQLLEESLRTLGVAWNFPNPWGLSPGPEALHWLLTDQPLHLVQHRVPGLGFDRAQVSCVGGPTTELSALRCVAEATVGSLAPATAPWLRKGFGMTVAASVLPHALPTRPFVAAQNAPEEGVFLPTDDGRSSLFFDYLRGFSPPASPLAAPLALLLVSATRTAPGALRWDAEPDLIDAIRVNLEGDRNRFARFIDDFALYRWTGATSDPSLKVQVAWDVDRSSLPRTLVLPRPLAPGGTTYLRIRLQNAPPGRVAIRIYCEQPVSYVWSTALLDVRDHVERHIPITFREQSPNAEALIGELGSAASLLLMGTNLGGVDLAHPFDPDHAPHERHSCRVTFNWLDDAGARSQKAKQ